MKTSSLSPQSTTYDHDYYLWIREQIQALQSGQVQHLDIENLIEELEDMGKRERRSVRSNVIIVMLHLLKYQFQPQQRSNSWLATLIEHRLRLRDEFVDSPSLKNYVAESSVFAGCYEDACERASRETGLNLLVFPPSCPYSLAQILDKNFLPE